MSKHRAARLDAIANRIAQSTYDIVALQEIWVYSDFENLVRKTGHILPYAKFYYSGVLGGGLAILSKWPLDSTTMWRYPLNGRPTAFWRGDWYVGKGVASALIRHPSGQLIEVFNTHVSPVPARTNERSCMHHMDMERILTCVIEQLRLGILQNFFARQHSVGQLLSGYIADLGSLT